MRKFVFLLLCLICSPIYAGTGGNKVMQATKIQPTLTNRKPHTKRPSNELEKGDGSQGSFPASSESNNGVQKNTNEEIIESLKTIEILKECANIWVNEGEKGYGVGKITFILGAFYDGKYSFKKALSKWYLMAERANPEDQLNPQEFIKAANKLEALKWYQISANQANPEAQYRLGLMLLLNGENGIIQNLEEAAHWFTLSANQGHPEAKFLLGLMYEKGKGVDQDPQKANKLFQEALELLQKAAGQGNNDAAESLEIIRKHCEIPTLSKCRESTSEINDSNNNNSSGTGMEAGGTAQTSEPFQNASSDLDSNASIKQEPARFTKTMPKSEPKPKSAELSVLDTQQDQASTANNSAPVQVGNLVDPTLLPPPPPPIFGDANNNETSQSPALSTQETFQNAEYQFGLGFTFEVGHDSRHKNVEKANEHYQAAIDFYQQAAEQGHAKAAFYLGYMFAKGKGVKRNPEKAAAAIRMAAEKNNKNAQFKLATMLATGKDIQKNPEEAISWYQKAADQGHKGAQYNLGYLYFKDNKFTDAITLFQRAAEKGLAQAQYMYGLMLEKGKGVEKKNPQKALEWIKKAADQNFKLAQNKLKQLVPEKPIESSSSDNNNNVAPLQAPPAPPKGQDLLSAKKGLKSAEEQRPLDQKPASEGTPRENLLAAIRAGTTLKDAEKRTLAEKTSKPKTQIDLFSEAMAARRRFIDDAQDSTTSESEREDDNVWEE